MAVILMIEVDVINFTCEVMDGNHYYLLQSISLYTVSL